MKRNKINYKLKKILAASLCSVSLFSLLTFSPAFNNLSYAEESGYSDEQNTNDNDNKEEKETPKAAVVLTVIIVFTLTAAVTSVLTYKKHIHSKN